MLIKNAPDNTILVLRQVSVRGRGMEIFYGTFKI